MSKSFFNIQSVAVVSRSHSEVAMGEFVLLIFGTVAMLAVFLFFSVSEA
jgi:hypothetical protein